MNHDLKVKKSKGKKKGREKKEEGRKRREKKKGRRMIAFWVFFEGHENVSNFCFARFAREKESTVLNRKKKPSYIK